MVKDMTPLQMYGTAITLLRSGLPEHKYHQIPYNKSHAAASNYGNLRTWHDRACERAEEYVTGYPTLSPESVLEAYKYLREAAIEYSTTLREDKQDAISGYICLIDNVECKHRDLELGGV